MQGKTPFTVVAAIKVRMPGAIGLVEIDPSTDVRGGLAVHPAVSMTLERGLAPDPSGRWTVTHVSTGLRVLPDLWCEAAARDAIGELGLLADWTVLDPTAPAHRDAKLFVESRHDTGEVRQLRESVARALGIAPEQRDLGVAGQLTPEEVRIMAAITNTGESAVDIARRIRSNVIASLGDAAQRRALTVLNRLMKRGLVEKRAGAPVTWFIKPISAS